jgi:sulfonate transport system substrate-binding protein
MSIINAKNINLNMWSKLINGLVTTGLVAGFMGVFLFAHFSSAEAKPLEIRISWSVTPQHLTPLIPKMPKSVYRHYGKTYVVKPVRLRGSGATHTALASKEIDIAGFNYQAFGQGIVNAKQDIKAIAQVLADKPPYGGGAFWVRKESNIRKLSDLKGKVIAVNAFGGTVQATAVKMLGDQGLKQGKDFKVVEVRFPAMLPALETKQVDASYLVMPFKMIAKRKGKFEQLFSAYDAFGPIENVIWAVRSEFLKNNRSQMVDFMEDHIRMRRWVHEEKNRKEIVDIIAKATKRPAKNYMSWVFTKKDNFRSLDAKFDPKLLQKNLDDLQALGYLKAKIDLNQYSDLTLADEALKRIK